jgi:predicted phosphodiesterase
MLLDTGGTLSRMRIAALYDIHANLPALDAVLHEVRESAVDQLVIGGDVVPGPMPRETIARLLAIDMPIQFIQGNGDREIVSLRRGLQTDGFPEAFRPMMQWVADQLTPADEQLLASWPAALTMAMPGVGDALFCHATPRNDTEIFTRTTPEAAVATAVSEVAARVMICGHTHMQFDRTVSGIRIVNAGSVGMPFQAPGAYWLLLDSHPAEAGAHVTLRRTDYDLSRAAAAVRQTGYPLADDFAANNILQPPTEQAMLDAFSRVAIK